ncbi:MAG: PBP1A family penicillin-binding protein [Acidobacteriota bacterium]|nr:MAG: PBP1A family penicillin-binding protein [Acidobacteriota bacterium]
MAKIRKSYYRTWRSAPFRTTFRTLTSPYVFAPLLILGLIALGVLFYYYDRYTRIIDAGLRGDTFVRSSGIYAAPYNVTEGTDLRMSEVMAHLQAVGYLERGRTDNSSRGQYTVSGDVIEVFPGGDTLIDGMRAFRSLRIDFDRSGRRIQSISDIETRERVAQAQLEPELISTVINPEREKRKIIVYRDLPKTLVDGIVAIEDRQFFEHPGINWRGILRALIRDYQIGELREGGSSITQQLVKNFFLKPEKTWKRKLSEAYMSILLEQRLSKQDIMAMYCNQIYLGQRGGFSINGFGQASRTYFGKDISNLNLQESALLAGIIRSPNYYSPFTNEERAKDRRNLVIEKMVEAGKLSRADAEAAKQMPLGVVSKAAGIDASDAPYFVDYLMRLTEDEATSGGEPLHSLRIYSTIDLDLQRAAYQAVVKNMEQVEKLIVNRRGGTSGLQAALVAMNAKTGEILALVGGRNYAASQLNRAVDAKRQPGSVFKPFVYATALELRNTGVGPAITPATMFNDEPRTFEYDGKRYDPGNFGDKYEMMPMTVRDALVNSKNVITVELAERIGFGEIQRFAERAGLPNIPPYPSMALGVGEATPLQMTSAYTAFANQGRRVNPIAIRRMTTRDGATLYESKTETSEVMTPQVAYIMTSMLQDVLDRGTGTRVRQMGFRGVAAGKTGSSRDGWFAGYTPNLVCVVWVGFDDNSDLRLTGGATAAPIWADFMVRALRVRPDLAGAFPMPEEGVIAMDIDPATGSVASESTPNRRTELFLKGTEPGSQMLPDYSVPDLETQPGMTPAESPRTKPPGEESFISGRGNEDFIPLPPNTRRRVVSPTPQPGALATGARRPTIQQIPPRPTEGKPSFMRRLAEAFGFSSSPSTQAQPAPTPWTNAGLESRTPRPTPVPRPAVSSDIPLPPDARMRPAEPPDPDRSPQKRGTDTGTVAQVDSRRPVARPTPIATPPPAEPREGTFILEVCATSGLLPVKGLCTSTVKKRFELGKEPTAFCNSSLHKQ